MKRPRSRTGLSLVEVLLALVITSMLLTAVMVAIHASFRAYATAARSASTNSSTRLVVQRVLTMVRVGTLHDAYDPNDGGVTLGSPAAAPVQSVGIQMIDQGGGLVRLWWQVNGAYGDADLGDLWYQLDGNAAQPLLGSVQCLRTAGDDPYIFTLASRGTSEGLLLARATLDLTLLADGDATLALEEAAAATLPIRMVGSTMPRRTMLD